MSLNIVVDAISSGDIKTVTKETLVATAALNAQTDKTTYSADATGVGTLTNPANNTNPERDNGWIVPGSVKVYTKTATVLTLQDYTISNSVRTRTPGTLAFIGTTPANQDGSKGTVNYTTGAVTLTFETALATGDEIYVDYQYFTVQRQYTAGAVPTTLRYRNDKDTALIVIAESDDGENWLQVGAHNVQPWEIYNLDRVTQRQLTVCSTSSGRLVGSPLSAI